MKNNHTSITIVLISHKSIHIVLKFIDNLSRNFNILIIDNSNDLDLKKAVENYKNVDVKFMANKGYGAAINYARHYVTTKYFFVFSPDVKNIDNKLLIKFEEKEKKIKSFGTLGPRFLNVTEKSHKQSNVNEEIGKINSISGAAMFFDIRTFDDIGGFDENIFLYFEETDYCKRAEKKGYKIYQINSATVDHTKGINFGVVKTKNIKEINDLEKLYSWHFIWSKYYFFKKHYGKIFSIIYFIPILIRILFRINLYRLRKNKDKKEKYKSRLDGLTSSMRGMTSFKRL